MINNSNNNDLLQIIVAQREQKRQEKWTGTILDYLKIIKDNPDIAANAAKRLYQSIMSFGSVGVDEEKKTVGYDDLQHYSYFDGKIFGTLEPIHNTMKFLKAGANRTETGKRILLLVGPPAGGKSSIVYYLKRCLEQSQLPKYVVSGCPIHEEPLNMIPYEDRPYWEKYLGVTIEGHPCPICKHNLETNFKDSVNNYRWEEMPVESFQFSEIERKGIGVFQPSDPISQDESELIGKINYSKAGKYGDADPRSYLFDGALEVANGGMLDFIELLKANERLLYLLITVAQEKLVKSPSGSFPQIYTDCVLIGHTNLSEYESFIANKKNEALHDRIYVVKWPWNLRVSNEVLIYKKLIQESEFRNIHIAPETLEVAARFAILTRLKPSPKCPVLVEKVKLYNNETSSAFKREECDVKGMFAEGRDNGEGLDGISPRYVINTLNIALARKTDKGCVNPVDIIKGLKYAFEHHIGYTPEEKERYMELLLGEKDSVISEYKEYAKKEVQLAFLTAYDEQAQSLFKNYLYNASAHCRNDRIYDETSGEYSKPDEKLMRSIEEHAKIPTTSKNEFRNSIFVYKSSVEDRGEVFTYQSFPILKDAIEKTLLSTLKNLVQLTLIDPVKSMDEKTKKRKESVIENLIQKGYCRQCAEILLLFVAEILRKQE